MYSWLQLAANTNPGIMMYHRYVALNVDALYATMIMYLPINSGL